MEPLFDTFKLFRLNSNWYILGYAENEMIKDGDIKLSEAEETCEAPKQKDFLALEVIMINF